MARSFFGTDGVRGVANRPPMTVETGVALGRAIAHAFRRGKPHPRILIGKDTRLSGYLFENALAAGVCAVGGEAYLIGPMPTPGVAFLTVNMRAEAGVMISASHNAYHDNGIKFFGHDGFKLDDDLEAQIAGWVLNEETRRFDVTGTEIGKAHRIRDVLGRYVVFLKSTFPKHLGLEGVRICLDCAHGAAYKLAPLVFEELGAHVDATGIAPNGTNINAGCGALYPDALRQAVLERGCHIGIALDGDADRCILIDETGRIVDGDSVLGMSALWLRAQGDLPGDAVVATVMSNLGLERALGERGVHMVRCNVGDRAVVQAMRKKGIALGGEKSGHVIFLPHATTGDGILTSLQVLSQMVATGRPLSELAGFYEPYPQVLRSLPVARRTPIDQVPPVQAAVETARERLGSEGRLNVRYSGTELKIRVMAEAEDAQRVESVVAEVCAAIETHLGTSAPAGVGPGEEGPEGDGSQEVSP